MRRAEEQRQQKNPFDPKAVRVRDDRDTGTAYLLQKAVNAPRGSDAREALLQQAMPLAPDWHETHRVAAYIHADSGRYEAARDAYERALELADDPTDRAIVEGFFAYELASHLNEPRRAIELAERAHAALGTPETACRLAQCLMIDRQFDAAEALFRTVLTAENAHSVLVARTSLMNLTKRRMERLRNDRRPLQAVKLGSSGLREATAYLDTGVSDGRLREQCLALCAEVFLAAVDVDDITSVTAELEFVSGYANARIEELRLSQHAGRLVASAHRVAGRADCEATLRATIAEIETRFGDGDAGELIKGYITSFDPDKGFGFANHPGLDLAVFLHRGELRDPSDQILLLPGAPISYALERNEKGFHASRVRVELSAAEQTEYLRQRSCTVTKKLELHLFARDSSTGAPVYIDQRAMPADDWKRIHEGTRIMCDLQQSARSPAARYRTVTLVG